MMRIHDFCRKNLDRPITVEMLAEVAGCSRGHFTRRFQELEGMSPHEFIIRQKMRLAVRLLQTTVASVKEISAALRRLVKPAPRIGFLTTNTSRSIETRNNEDYYVLADGGSRYSLLNQGFDIKSVSVEHDKAYILDSLDVLMVTDPEGAYSEEAMETLREYVRRGKNMIIGVKPDSYRFLQPLTADLGIDFEDGILVENPRKDIPANVVSCEIPSGSERGFSAYFNIYQYANYTVPGASPNIYRFWSRRTSRRGTNARR